MKKYILPIIIISIVWLLGWGGISLFLPSSDVAIEYEGRYNIWFQQDKVKDSTYYVWYPIKDNKDAEEVIASNAAFYGFSAIKNAEMFSWKFPVIFLFHGYEWNWKNQSWLAAQLARDGNIVISQDIKGFSSRDYSIDSFLTIEDTIYEINANIKTILFDSRWSSNIDIDNISAGGTSLWGFIAAILWWSKYNLYNTLWYCDKKELEICKFLSPISINIKDKNIYLDEKSIFVTKTFLLAPGLIESIYIGSELPQLIITAENDNNIDNDIVKSFSGLESNYLELDKVDHFVFLQVCRPWAIEVLKKYDWAAKVCLQSDTRRQVHKNIFKKIKEFLAG